MSERKRPDYGQPGGRRWLTWVDHVWFGSAVVTVVTGVAFFVGLVAWLFNHHIGEPPAWRVVTKTAFPVSLALFRVATWFRKKWGQPADPL